MNWFAKVPVEENIGWPAAFISKVCLVLFGMDVVMFVMKNNRIEEAGTYV